MNDVSNEEIDSLFAKLNTEAESSGYHLNPDEEFVRMLLEGLIVNVKRYGYQACPCRLASGDKEEDLDIICPCDYRDPDLVDYDTCYCCLYVSEAVVRGVTSVSSIPDRRPPAEDGKKSKALSAFDDIKTSAIPVWRCKVCGYLCARENPPERCPICKVEKERFERFT